MSMAALKETFNPAQTQAATIGFDPSGMDTDKAARLQDTLQKFGSSLNQALANSPDTGVNLPPDIAANLDDLPKNGQVEQLIARTAHTQQQSPGRG